MKRSVLTRRAALLALSSLRYAPAATAAGEDAVWAALREGGAVAVIRHAHAPGSGDPPGFRLGDCRTQRNLDARGRAQASAIGARFRAERVPVTDVKSSRWCRALDTATIAFPAVIIEPNAALDSLYRNPDRVPAQTDEVRRMAQAWGRRYTTLVLVTHQVNITALTGVVPAEGEIVVMRASAGGPLAVVGRIRP